MCPRTCAGGVRLLIFLALAVCGASFARAADVALEGVADLHRVARLLGTNSMNQTDTRWNVGGADLGHMFDMGDRLYMVFGDTFGQGLVAPPGSGAAPDWRSNVMAVIADKDPSDGLTFESMITDASGNAKELIGRLSYTNEYTVIPTNGIASGGWMFLHYMSVQSWDSPGEWTLRCSGLAGSNDGGQHWSRVPWVWPGDSNFGQVAFVRDGGYVYLFGIPGGRSGGVCVARVPDGSLPTQSAYLYYAGTSNGAPVWSTDIKAAVKIVPPPVGELSVMWNPYLGRWIMTYLGGPDIVIREAPELLGPWSAPITLVSSKDYPGLYAPYMHPWLMERNGEIIYFTMSEWFTYSVSLMRVRLVKRLDMTDVARALAIAGGQAAASPEDVQRLAAGTGPLDLPACARLVRRVLGL